MQGIVLASVPTFSIFILWLYDGPLQLSQYQVYLSVQQAKDEHGEET
jgi:hypothetical protein